MSEAQQDRIAIFQLSLGTGAMAPALIPMHRELVRIAKATLDPALTGVVRKLRVEISMGERPDGPEISFRCRCHKGRDTIVVSVSVPMTVVAGGYGQVQESLAAMLAVVPPAFLAKLPEPVSAEMNALIVRAFDSASQEFQRYELVLWQGGRMGEPLWK